MKIIDIKWTTTPTTAAWIKSLSTYQPIKNAINDGMVIIIAINVPFRKIFDEIFSGVFLSSNL